MKTLIAMYDSLYDHREEEVMSDDPFEGRDQAILATLAGGDANLDRIALAVWGERERAAELDPVEEGRKVRVPKGKNKGWAGIAEKSMPSSFGEGRAFLVRQTLPPHEARWISEKALVCAPYAVGEQDNLARLKAACDNAPATRAPRGSLVEVGGRRGVLVRPRVASTHAPTMCAVHIEGEPKESYHPAYMVRVKADPDPLDPLAFSAASRKGGKA